MVAVGLAGHARIHGRSEPSVHGHELTILEWRPSLGSGLTVSWPVPAAVSRILLLPPRGSHVCCAARSRAEPRTMHATAAAGWSTQTAVMHCCPLHAGTLLTRAGNEPSRSLKFTITIYEDTMLNGC